MIVPVFPLPGAYLFPGVIMPLHVFEPRYRAMVEDLLDSPGRLVIAAVREGHEAEMAGAPPLEPVAGLGEIARHEKLPDGRFIIALMGLSRVVIDEVPSDRPYRLVEALPLEETAVPEAVQDGLRTALEEALRERATGEFELPEGVAIPVLTDLLIMQLELPRDRLSELFGEPETAARARAALAEHRARS